MTYKTIGLTVDPAGLLVQDALLGLARTHDNLDMSLALQYQIAALLDAQTSHDTTITRMINSHHCREQI